MPCPARGGSCACQPAISFVIRSRSRSGTSPKADTACQPIAKGRDRARPHARSVPLQVQLNELGERQLRERHRLSPQPRLDHVAVVLEGGALARERRLPATFAVSIVVAKAPLTRAELVRLAALRRGHLGHLLFGSLGGYEIARQADGLSPGCRGLRFPTSPVGRATRRPRWGGTEARHQAGGIPEAARSASSGAPSRCPRRADEPPLERSEMVHLDSSR
jgi:hypothetical protein